MTNKKILKNFWVSTNVKREKPLIPSFFSNFHSFLKPWAWGTSTNHCLIQWVERWKKSVHKKNTRVARRRKNDEYNLNKNVDEMKQMKSSNNRIFLDQYHLHSHNLSFFLELDWCERMLDISGCLSVWKK